VTDTPVPTVTDTPVPTVTDTPVPTVTDTPVPVGSVDVSKSVNPSSGSNLTAVQYTITIDNNTNAPITLNEIVDDMTAINEFNGTSCTYPDNSQCVPPGSQPAVWRWSGALVIPRGGSVSMTISGTFARFLPPLPTPTPDPQQFCNTATILYNGSVSGSSNQECFTLN
jgi:hypothetical protein